MSPLAISSGSSFSVASGPAGRSNGTRTYFNSGRGKGSHGRLYYGARFTTLKDRKKEIGPGLLNAMLYQLGLTKKDLENQ